MAKVTKAKITLALVLVVKAKHSFGVEYNCWGSKSFGCIFTGFGQKVKGVQ